VQGLVGGGKLPTQSAYMCALLELCTRVKLNACLQVTRYKCCAGGAEERVSWLGIKLNLGGGGVWCGRSIDARGQCQFHKVFL
jgi:hypothetical protein